MATHRALADIAAEIVARGLPAVFFDTCGALDVVRCAARGQPRVAGIVRQFLDAEAAGELLLVAPSVLPKEAARNRVEVESDTRKRARAVDEAVAAHRRVAHTLGVPYPYVAQFSHETLVGPLVRLHDRLLAACVYASTEPAIESAALRRGGDNRRPARKGGGANDCLLFEEFLSIARAAPAANPLVLLTTNADDFGDTRSPDGVHADLTVDLAGTSALVCLSWDRAAARVLKATRLRLV